MKVAIMRVNRDEQGRIMKGIKKKKTTHRRPKAKGSSNKQQREADVEMQEDSSDYEEEKKEVPMEIDEEISAPDYAVPLEEAGDEELSQLPST